LRDEIKFSSMGSIEYQFVVENEQQLIIFVESKVFVNLRNSADMAVHDTKNISFRKGLKIVQDEPFTCACGPKLIYYEFDSRHKFSMKSRQKSSDR